eukprot:NODE_4297_length_810_cov_44.793558_g4139_i0.p1 GENE.NODE_4297_length_810_cov_44.793558_g4139_i0~~NODE_4297_length_810_cov_44.793558_g4139_i0.p1  ORF type:complete len:260 (+),score=109.14 NODE_4297_length_810_cov_44.793558_g4139_i0:63-782(+)
MELNLKWDASADTLDTTIKQAASASCPLTIYLDTEGAEFHKLNEALQHLYSRSTLLAHTLPVVIIPTNAQRTPLSAQEKQQLWPCHSHVALGGTFDQLHNGHKLLLTVSALCCSGRLRVGVANNKLLEAKQYAHLIQPVHHRMHTVRQFLTTVAPDLTLDIFDMEEFTGGTTTMEGLDAIVVSPETRPSAEKINAQRLTNALPPLAILVIEYVSNPEHMTDFKLSSGGLRAELHAKQML